MLGSVCQAQVKQILQIFEDNFHVEVVQLSNLQPEHVVSCCSKLQLDILLVCL